MRIEDNKYNIHWCLWDLFKITSNWLCKKGYHLYMIQSKSKIHTYKYIEDGAEITKNQRIWLPAFYKCHCCGKEIQIKE